MSGRFYYPNCRAILQVVFDGYKGERDDLPRVIPVLPKSATVHVNSYRMADSWEVTFDANDLPIDPRQVRSGAIELYMFQTQGVPSDLKVVSRQFATTDQQSANKARTSIVALEREFSSKEIRDRFTYDNKPRVVGLFDSHDLEMSQDGKWVTISGQDYTAFLAAKQWPPTERGTVRRIPVGKSLFNTLSEILAAADTDGRLELVAEGIEVGDTPTVGRAEADTNRGRGIPVDEKTSYWDVMYKLATRYGFILFVRGLDVVLTRPKNIDSASHAVRRFAWGKNLSSIRMTRNLGKLKVPRIIMRGYDVENRRVVSVEFPDTGLGAKQIILKGISRDKHRATEKIKATDGTVKSPKKKAKTLRREDEYQIIPMFGVSDKTILARAAENLYQLLGSSERKIVTTTNDLLDLDQRELLDLQTGDAVLMEWQDFDAEMIGDDEVPTDTKYAHLIARGFNSEVAREIAQNYELLLQEKRPMRMREATFDWDVDTGIAIEMELIDFVVVDGQRDVNSAEEARAKRLRKARKTTGERIGDPLIDSGRLGRGATP